MTTLNAERLKELLSYDPETGEFRWLKSGSGRRPDLIAGGANNVGYIQIRIGGKAYSAHRLAWLYTSGKWPEKWIDHISGDKLDNRIANLREANRSQNTANSRIRSTNTSGITGVRWNTRAKKFVASIKLNRRHIHLGFYDFKEEAAAARKSAETKYFGEFARSAYEELLSEQFYVDESHG